MNKPIYVLSGPNLNLLGEREPEIYGRDTLEEIHERLRSRAGDREIVTRQSNSEGELIDWIQEARTEAAGLILNAAAYTHTSLAIYDALSICAIPIVECHLSNPAAREEFRKVNHISPAATGSIAGFGARSYELALDAVLHLVETGNEFA